MAAHPDLVPSRAFLRSAYRVVPRRSRLTSELHSQARLPPSHADYRCRTTFSVHHQHALGDTLLPQHHHPTPFLRTITPTPRTPKQVSPAGDQQHPDLSTDRARLLSQTQILALAKH